MSLVAYVEIYTSPSQSYMTYYKMHSAHRFSLLSRSAQTYELSVEVVNSTLAFEELLTTNDFLAEKVCLCACYSHIIKILLGSNSPES